MAALSKHFSYFWHFCHLNPILCTYLLKDCSPQGMFTFSRFWKEFFTSWNSFVFNTEVLDPTSDHAEMKIVNH